MNKVIFISDMHVGHITSLPAFLNFLDRVKEQVNVTEVGAVIVGGDFTDYKGGLKECLTAVTTAFPLEYYTVAYISGNHDIWRRYWHRRLTSDEVFYKEIPNICSDVGVTYLEEKNFMLGNWMLGGSVGWYDYSAKREGPVNIKLLPDEYYAENKKGHNADAIYVDFTKSDIEMAKECTTNLVNRLKVDDGDDVDYFGVFTHVPVFAEAIQWKDNDWNLGSPYFYNLSMGDELLKLSKLRLVASGHTHYGIESSQVGVDGQEVTHLVSNSDYGKPEAYEIDLFADGSTYYKRIF